ncbi:protein phosphatase [Amycolatopsis arida]|uniref:Protein phosphatase n=1 Tax=Amycolatopsis arida TaxID=587909 RepID=A0A1I5ZSG3_9PSEU|nr:protein phosphatase 2C domain-containing protein [Amycolatopsis arida]TDX89338.1 protein phosphatase [Amycolatopsis arida]SFQ59398.1 protein phosphatase [Amycolatopsis arida]
MTHDLPSPALGFSPAVLADPGRRLTRNEDSAYGSVRLLAVADGIGGQPHGEVASAVAIAAVRDADRRLPADPGDDTTALSGLVSDIARRLAAAADEDERLRGMGTTLTALLCTGTEIVLAHVGDSRGYLLRDGALRRITTDHTLVEELIRGGQLPAEQAGTHPRRSVLLRALQTGAAPDADLSRVDARAGDRVLLCSDGITCVLPDDVLRDVLAGHRAPHDAARRLVELANDRGGPDNIACTVADLRVAPAPVTPLVAGAAVETPAG